MKRHIVCVFLWLQRKWWALRYPRQRIIRITMGTAAGQQRRIVREDKFLTATVHRPWKASPDTSSRCVFVPPGHADGLHESREPNERFEGMAVELDGRKGRVGPYRGSQS